MDDIIFERDYRRTQEDVDRTSTAIKIFSQAFNGSFILSDDFLCERSGSLCLIHEKVPLLFDTYTAYCIG